LKALTAASYVVIMLLLSPVFVPLGNALPQNQDNVKVLSFSINGSVGNARVEVDGIVYDINATISSGSGGDPTVSTPVGYARFPSYIGNPPYAAWWNGISNPPEIYIYIDSGVAFNGGNGVAGIAGLLTILAAATVGIAAAITAGVVELLYLDYSTIYGADHNADGSMSLWIPIDWVNYAVLFEGSHDLYVATPNYWWLCLAGIAIRSNR
jgi:hypothetical protein